MTMEQAIAWVDEKKHNVYSRQDKLRWLTDQELQAREFLGGFGDSFPEDTPEPAGELVIPAPWDRVYLYWLESMIDWENREVSSYNASAALHRAAWQDWQRSVLCSRRHRGQKLRCV